MIESAESFKNLRESKEPKDYTRAAQEEASVEVWYEVLDVYPEMAFWVAQNKTVPIEVLIKLASSNDPDVRSMVARKRKIPESLMLNLAQDFEDSVRHAVACNAKVTQAVLKILSNDSWDVVRKVALEKIKAQN